MLDFLIAEGSGNTGCNDAVYIPVMIVVAVLLIAVMVIFPMINNKRQKKQVEEQRSSLAVGDVVETVGGIIGVLKEIRTTAAGRKELVIETGNEGSKTTITVDIQALYMVLEKSGNAPTMPATAPVTAQEERIKERTETAVDPFESTGSADAPAEQPEAAAGSDKTAEAPAQSEDKPATADKKSSGSSKKTK